MGEVEWLDVCAGHECGGDQCKTNDEEALEDLVWGEIGGAISVEPCD